MVNWWFGARWFGFLGSPYEKELGILQGTPNHQAPNHQFIITSLKIKVWNPNWNLSGGYFQVPLGRSRKLVSGLFHLPINGTNWGYNPLILTIDPNFDILPHAAVRWTPGRSDVVTWLKPKALERFWGKVHCDQNLGVWTTFGQKKNAQILLCTTFKKYL